MRPIDAAKPKFARHETFHPRYGWFRKAYRFAAADPHAFSREDAPVRIGVGKNMVRAIRFWGLAAKLIEEKERTSNRRASELIPTSLGDALFGESGWDQYMEDPGTLWLLHWLLLAPPSLLPVWWIAFNDFPAVEFDDDDLLRAVGAQIEAIAEWNTPHPSSLKKDVGAMLRTYAPVERTGRSSIDDILDCPLRELNLIGRSVGTNRYRFALGTKPTLPAAILGYAALDYSARTSTGGNTVTIGRLVHEPGAPGKVFKLTEGEFLAAIEPLIRETDAIALTTSTGAVQLSWSGKPSETAIGILDRYYSCFGSNTRADRTVRDDARSLPVISALGR
ncbi:MAG: DUF4007 family protein [Gammaproteobacteria bacterium]|nr:DUF4007 family protein [Gammaproteobacteria bacterium]